MSKKIVHEAYPKGDACGQCGSKVEIFSIPPNAEEAYCEKCGWSYYRKNVEE